MNRFCIFIVVLLWNLSVFGQLLTVGNQKVSQEDFVRLYKKNILNPTFSEQSLREYLDLLITYKLKVQEAVDLNLEQLPHLQRELNNYASQLAQPYLTDLNFLEKMLRDIHNYSLQDVHARQIMVRCPPFSRPQDSLNAYRTALRIRERLVRGEDFDKVAKEESEKSELVALGSRQERRISSSDLRYFSALSMPYSIENFAFNARVGDFSTPLRTEIGFHIVQILDRQPTLGRINASQIFLNISDEDQAETIRLKADSLYYLITSGTKSFEELARQYSDDRTSGMRGGRMAEFNVTRADPAFIAQLYKMPLEVVARPFRTRDGYHIVIIHSLGDVADYQEVRSELLFRLQRDPRADLIRQSFVNSLRKDYPIVEIGGALKNFASQLDSMEIMGFWEYERDNYSDSALVKVGSIIATYADFGRLIEDNQTNYNFEQEDFMAFIERNYRRYIDDLLVLNEEQNIGKKHPQFNLDFETYRNDVLAFEITDLRIWKKSNEDTVGLYEYYESQKHCFMWPARIQALTFRYDVRYINTNDVRKFLEGSYRRRHSAEQIIEQANRNFDPKHISVTINVYEPGQNKIADRVDWTRPGLSPDVATGGFEKGFVYIYNHYPSTCKSLEEIRGTIVGQYQDFLEQQWVDELKRKYPVHVNQNEFESLIKR